MLTHADAVQTESDRVLFSRIAWRLLPFLFLLYVISYLDRANVSFAGKQMRLDLGMSERAYGLGAGIFFVGYALFEVPSNLILQRVGARRWICRIMLTWGIISTCMVFIRGPKSFCALRFLLGLAEAGFFPGVILYLTYWFPAARRARAVALFMTATALSMVFGSLCSSYLLGLGGRAFLGWVLTDWQWVFFIEGLPAILMGFVVLMYLPDGPGDARWLSEAGRARIQELLAHEHAEGAHRHAADLMAAIKEPRLWLLTFVYFCMAVGLYCVSFWLPQVIDHGWPGHSAPQVTLMSAIPFGAAAICMALVGMHSDKTGERRWHVCISLVVGALGSMATAMEPRPLVSAIALTIAAMGIWSTFGPFWSLPPAFLSGTAAAGGIALANALASLGGLVGPYIFGYVKQRTGNFVSAFWVLSVILLAGAGVVMFVKVSSAPRAAGFPVVQRGRD